MEQTTHLNVCLAEHKFLPLHIASIVKMRNFKNRGPLVIKQWRMSLHCGNEFMEA
jgi:hypothetical protein